VDFPTNVSYVAICFKWTFSPKYEGGLSMMHQLGCFYLILCGVWTTIGVGIDMVAHKCF
jgi:hypothetical protein